VKVVVSRFSDFSRRMNHGLRIVIIKQIGAQSCVTNLAAYFELKKVEIQNVFSSVIKYTRETMEFFLFSKIHKRFFAN